MDIKKLMEAKSETCVGNDMDKARKLFWQLMNEGNSTRQSKRKIKRIFGYDILGLYGIK